MLDEHTTSAAVLYGNIAAPALSRSNMRRPGVRRRAFTIIELLVVAAIVIVLLSILVVAVTAAKTSALKANTLALMNSMKQGLVRFKEDVGYYPPVLGVGYTPAGNTNPTLQELRRLFPNSVPNPTATYAVGSSYIQHMQEYFSTCTLADYLIGYGPNTQDGYGNTTNEIPPLGIRHPSNDGVWNATVYTSPTAPMDLGALTRRTPVLSGKVLGPYFEMKDQRLLAAVYYGPNGLETFFPGDQLPSGLTWDEMPKAIVDYWGMPIRYYRKPYPAGALGQSYRAVDWNNDGVTDPVPTLSDVFALRPQTVKSGSESTNSFADSNGHNVSSRDLDAADFALLSSGPDRVLHQGATIHEDNVDNLVEVGP